jgi:tRNA pseudouridine55 synthase
MVESALDKFKGEQKQVPPLHSAKMIGGRRAYEFARQGIKRTLEPATIAIREINLVSFDLPEIKLRVRCSKGTYVRALARDIGEALGSGCYLSSLTRTAIGTFMLKDAYTLGKFENYLEQLQQNAN